MGRLAAYTRRTDTANSSSDGGEEGGEDAEGEGQLDEGEAAAAAVRGLQLAGGAAGAAGARPPAIESPDSAVKRLAAQRHADMMARSAAAGTCAAAAWVWEAAARCHVTWPPGTPCALLSRAA